MGTRLRIQAFVFFTAAGALLCLPAAAFGQVVLPGGKIELTGASATATTVDITAGKVKVEAGYKPEGPVKIMVFGEKKLTDADGPRFIEFETGLQAPEGRVYALMPTTYSYSLPPGNYHVYAVITIKKDGTTQKLKVNSTPAKVITVPSGS